MSTRVKGISILCEYWFVFWRLRVGVSIVFAFLCQKNKKKADQHHARLHRCEKTEHRPFERILFEATFEPRTEGVLKIEQRTFYKKDHPNFF